MLLKGFNQIDYAKDYSLFVILNTLILNAPAIFQGVLPDGNIQMHHKCLAIETSLLNSYSRTTF